MRRRRNPLQPGVLVHHIPLPALHRDNVQVARLTDHPFAVEQHRQFAAGQPIDIRDAVLADEAEKTVLHQRPFNLPSSERIGPVEHDEFDTVLGGGGHRFAHRADVGERPAADVLDVVHQHVDPPQHLRRRFPRLAVQRIDRQSGHGIGLVAQRDRRHAHRRARRAPARTGPPTRHSALRSKYRPSTAVRRSTPVGFVINPTRLPSSSSNRCAFNTSIPVLTTIGRATPVPGQQQRQADQQTLFHPLSFSFLLP